jgi:hypothetical protein
MTAGPSNPARGTPAAGGGGEAKALLGPTTGARIPSGGVGTGLTIRGGSGAGGAAPGDGPTDRRCKLG